MSKAIIFTGGGAPSRLPADLLQSGDMVIAADSGYEAAKALGIPVSLCLGDFDSTQLFSEIRNMNYEKSLSEKDESDTELALRKASSLGFSTYILVGGGGGFRMDTSSLPSASLTSMVLLLPGILPMRVYTWLVRIIALKYTIHLKPLVLFRQVLPKKSV